MDSFLFWRLFLLLSCIPSIMVGAQVNDTGKIDSLYQKVRNEKTDTLKYQLYDSLVILMEEVDRVAVIDILKEKYALAQVLKDDNKIARTAARLGANYMYSGLTDSAQIYLVTADSLFQKNQDLTRLNENLNNLALLYQRINRYEQAVEAYQDVIVYSDSLSDYIGTLFAYVNLMSVFMDIKDPVKALEYFDDIEQFLEAIPPDETTVLKEIKNYYSAIYLNAGQCHDDLQALDSAMYYFRIAESYLDSIEYEYSKTYFGAYVDHSIGNVLFKQAKTDASSLEGRQNMNRQALDYYNRSYEAFKSIENDRGIALSLNDVGAAQNELGDYFNAQRSLSQALEIARTLGFREEIRDAYGNLATNEEYLGNHKVANEYLRLWVSYRDSIRNEERDKLIQSQQIKFETSQKEKEIAQLAYENAVKSKQQTVQRYIFLLSLLLLGGAAAGALARYRYVKQKEKVRFEQEINQAMSRFVPMDFIRAIGREKITDVRLGDQTEKIVTVLFTDIRSFTTISESMTPADNFEFVKEYAGRMGPIILRHGGFVSQYLGDGIMAIFQNSPQEALIACIEMQREIKKYNEIIVSKGREPIKVGMGLHTGPLVMGIIGDELRLDATLISDTVNTAARIESTTKEVHSDILISQQSYDALSDPNRFYLSPKGEIMVKGKTIPITVYDCDHQKVK